MLLMIIETYASAVQRPPLPLYFMFSVYHTQNPLFSYHSYNSLTPIHYCGQYKLAEQPFSLLSNSLYIVVAMLLSTFLFLYSPQGANPMVEPLAVLGKSHQLEGPNTSSAVPQWCLDQHEKRLDLFLITLRLISVLTRLVCLIQPSQRTFNGRTLCV